MYFETTTYHVYFVLLHITTYAEIVTLAVETEIKADFQQFSSSRMVMDRKDWNE